MYYALRSLFTWRNVAFQNTFYYELTTDAPLPNIDENPEALYRAWAFDVFGYEGLVQKPGNQFGDYLPSDGVLEKVTVYPVNDLFQLEYENPFTYNPGYAGMNAQPDWLPPFCQVNFTFSVNNFRPTDYLNPFTTPPTRSHIRFGPIPEAYTDNGYITDAEFPGYQSLANILQSVVTHIPSGRVFSPRRATFRTVKDPTGLITLYQGYTAAIGISGCTANKRVSTEDKRKFSL